MEENRSVDGPLLTASVGAESRALRTCMYTAEAQRGHARYTRDLLSALSQAGARRSVAVELVTSRDIDPSYRTPLYPIHAILPPLLNSSHFHTTAGWAASRVAHYLRRERIFLDWIAARKGLDLVHFQEYTPWLAPVHFARLRRRGLGLVATVHNVANFGHSSRSYMRVSQRCWKSGWRQCSALVVHTEGLRATLADFLGPGHPPIFVVRHAVWEERALPPAPAEPPRVGEPSRLLFFGMIRPNKGLHVLLRSLKRLPDCRLTVVGEPEGQRYFEDVRALAAALPEGQVEIVSQFVAESEIAGFFDRAHLVALPYTEFAAQSGVLQQAVAHGRPVVATDVGGLGESVRDWGIGAVVAAGDEAALAAGITRMLRPDAYRAAALATTRVRDEHTWTEMAEATLDVYRTVAG